MYLVMIGKMVLDRKRADLQERSLRGGTIETNQVGVDEFLPLLQELSIEPLMAVNLGTGTPKEAGELIEYCNLKENTYWSSKRKENGHDAYEVRYWCMGNRNGW